MLDNSILYSVFAGKALLFLGAGFSSDAKRVMEDGTESDLPTGQKLACELLHDLETDIHDVKPLSACAAFYERKKTRDGLLRALGNKLEVSEAQKFHYDILSYPWWRIYTTNYDNLVQIATPKDKRLKRIGLHDSLPKYTTNRIDCLYINGYLDFNDIEQSKIVITKDDYASLNPARDLIIANFVDDAIMAEKVFFIGYSLYDIEVAKILQNNKSIKEKVYFIVGEEIDEIDEQDLRSFGSVFKISTQEFSQYLFKAATCYKKLPVIPITSFSSLQKYEIGIHEENNDDVFELFMHSRINRSRLKRQFGDQRIYAIPRIQLEEVRQGVLGGTPLTGIHAKLCNGKTVFLEELAVKLLDSMPVYFARVEAPSLGSDLIGLSRQLGENRATILVDGYGRAFEHLARTVGKSPNLLFVIAERTPIHRELWGKISKNVPNAPVFSLNQLEDIEKENFAELIRANGLSGKSKRYIVDRIDSLYGNSLGRTIFSLIKMSEVARKYIGKLRNDINLSKSFEDELYAAVILSVICGGSVPKTLINSIVGRNTAYTHEFCKSKIFEDMLEDDNNHVLCGSGIALEIAKFVFRPDKSLEILIKIITYLLFNSRFDYYGRLSEQCMRFFYLEKVLPEENFKNNVNTFYEKVKDIGNMGGHPLFWLQFAIAKYNQKEYPHSLRYLDTATEIAKGKDFNPYQIKNFRVRLLLTGDFNMEIDPWERFSEARSILLDHLANRNDEYLYRSAAELNSFLNVHMDTFDVAKLKMINQLVQMILHKSQEVIPEIQRESRHSLRRLADASEKLEKKLQMTETCIR